MRTQSCRTRRSCCSKPRRASGSTSRFSSTANGATTSSARRSGKTGLVRLPEPARAAVRTAGATRTAVPQDWRERFVAAFDVEFQEWIDAVAVGEPTGPSAWDGYAATVITDATVEALRSGRTVGVDMKDRPAFYAGGTR